MSTLFEKLPGWIRGASVLEFGIADVNGGPAGVQLARRAGALVKGCALGKCAYRAERHYMKLREPLYGDWLVRDAARELVLKVFRVRVANYESAWGSL